MIFSFKNVILFSFKKSKSTKAPLGSEAVSKPDAKTMITKKKARMNTTKK